MDSDPVDGNSNESKPYHTSSLGMQGMIQREILVFLSTENNQLCNVPFQQMFISTRCTVVTANPVMFVWELISTHQHQSSQKKRLSPPLSLFQTDLSIIRNLEISFGPLLLPYQCY